MSLSEAAFQKEILKMAALKGWKVMHIADSRRQVKSKKGYKTIGDAGSKGWPDLFLAHPRRGVRVFELKSDKGRLSAEQVVWLNLLTEAGLTCAVLRPRDVLTLGNPAHLFKKDFPADLRWIVSSD